MKQWMATGLCAMALGAGIGQAQAYDSKLTVGALAGTTGYGGEVSWRFHERLGVTAQYAGGLDWDGDYDTDKANYEGTLDVSAGALKVDYYPFGGSFYLTAGAMLPDMKADFTGRAKEAQTVEINGVTYTLDDVGTQEGTLTVADSVQPYAGLGWRSSHERGLGFFTELGIMTTDTEISLNAEGAASNNPQAQREIEAEERRLQEEADQYEVYPVAVLGVSYTF